MVEASRPNGRWGGPDCLFGVGGDSRDRKLLGARARAHLPRTGRLYQTTFRYMTTRLGQDRCRVGGPFPVRGDRSIPPCGGSPGVDSRRALKRRWPRQGVRIDGAKLEPSSQRNLRPARNGRSRSSTTSSVQVPARGKRVCAFTCGDHEADRVSSPKLHRSSSPALGADFVSFDVYRRVILIDCS